MTHINQRRDTAAGWAAANPVLQLGEVGWETNTRKSKLGDGSTPWNSLLYTVSDLVVTADDVGLGDADNTPDMDKPVSSATAAAIAAVQADADAAQADADAAQADADAAQADADAAQTNVDAIEPNVVWPVADAAARDALAGIHDGMMVYREDTDLFQARVSGAWQTMVTDTGWINMTLTGTSGWTIERARYAKRGDMIDFEVWATRTGATLTGDAVGNITDTQIADGGIPAGILPAATVNLQGTRLNTYVTFAALTSAGVLSLVFLGADGATIAATTQVKIRDAFRLG
jgi:hypothetical protein